MAGTILDYAPAPAPPGARDQGANLPLDRPRAHGQHRSRRRRSRQASLPPPRPRAAPRVGKFADPAVCYRPRAHGQHDLAARPANLPVLPPPRTRTPRIKGQICPLIRHPAPAHTGVRDQAANWLLDPSSDRRQTHRTAPSALLVGGPLSVPAYVVRTSPRGASVPLSTSRPWILSATQARPSWRLPGNPWGTRGARAPFRDLSFSE